MAAVVKPRLLLVDNDSDTLIELRALCDTLGYDVTTVHCSALDRPPGGTYDLTVLSGGYWYDDELQHLERYRAELDLIQTSRSPVIGICLGMQLLHVADSGMVPLLVEPQTGRQAITLTPEGETMLGLPGKLTVHKNHTRGIAEALPHYWTLAVSPHSVEIIKHRQRPLIGVQFHPEIGDRQQGAMILAALLTAVSL